MPQAAAAVRPRRLLRCLVLGAVFPALVRGEGLAGVRAFAARPWRRAAVPRRCSSAGLDDFVADVEHVAGELAAAADPDRAFDGRGDRRADDGDAPRARRGAAGAGAANRAPAGGRAARDDASRLCCSHMSGSIRRGLSDDILKVLRPFYFSPNVDPAILREAIASPQRRVAARAVRPFDAPALGSSRRGAVAGIRDGRRRTTGSPPGRRRGHRPPPRRRSDDPAGPGHMLMLEPRDGKTRERRQAQRRYRQRLRTP